MKKQANRNYIRRYRKMVTCAVPKDYPDRKRLMKRMERMLEDYQTEHSNASYEDFIREFGAPEELAASLIDSLTGEQVLALFHKREKREKLISFLIVFLAFTVTFSLIRITARVFPDEIKVTKMPTVYVNGEPELEDEN